MSKYNEELQKEAEKLARFKRIEGQKTHPLWFDFDDLHPTGKAKSIADMLPIARYVLEARAVAVKFGYACAQTDISFGLEIGVDIHLEELGYIEQKEGTENGEDGTDSIECEFCSQTEGHAYGCPNNIDPFNNLLNEGFD